MDYGLDDVAETVQYSLCQNCPERSGAIVAGKLTWDCPADRCPGTFNCVRYPIYERIMMRLKEIEDEIDANLGVNK